MGQPLAISSLPIAAPPAPRGARTLDLAEVARRLNVSERQARKRCEKEWFPRGLASMQSPGDGRKPGWHVRDDAHPLLARAVFPEWLQFDQTQLTTLQRKALQWRHAVYVAWREDVAAAIRKGGTAEEATNRFMVRLAADAALTPPAGVCAPTAASTLRAWHAGFRKNGIAALIDERWMRKADTSASLDHPFFAKVLSLYLNKKQPDLSIIHRVVSSLAGQEGWEVLSYKKCQRLLSRVPAAAKIKLRRGNKAYVDLAETFASRDYSGLRANEVWNGDHHRFDVLVSRKGKNIRPWLTLWQDVRSRKIVGFRVFVGDPNTDTIILAFRDAVAADGVPEEVYIDNGRDFDSQALQGITKRQRRQGIIQAMRGAEGIFTSLGVKVTHCQPYHGQSKPIERLFRIVKEEFSKFEATYCGGTPAEKPDDLAAKLKRGAAPTLEDFVEGFTRWVNYYNSARPHHGDSMDGRTPDAVFAACLVEKRTAPARVLDGLTLKPSKPLKIAQNGVRWMGLTFTASALWPRLGEEVRLHHDPEDIRTVHVYDLDGRFICLAEPVSRLPFKTSLEDLKQVFRKKAQDRRAVERYHQATPSRTLDVTEELNRNAAGRIVAAEPADAPSLRLIGGERAVEAEKAAQAVDRRRSAELEPRGPRMFDLVEAAANLPEPAPRAPSFRHLMENYMRNQATEYEAEAEADARFRAMERERMRQALCDEKRSAS